MCGRRGEGRSIQARSVQGVAVNLSFTLDSLFACPFGKLTLLSNEVNVEPACPKLSIVHRPATASSVRLVVLASVILLFFLRVTSQGAASSKQGRVEEGCTLRREEELVAPCGSACMLHVHVHVYSQTHALSFIGRVWELA